MLSSKRTAKNVVDVRHPDLIICCFVRRECPQEVPVALVNLMESFYSMWKKRRLSSSELQSIKLLTRRQSKTVNLFRFKVKGIVLQISLVAERRRDVVMVWLEAFVPPEVEYIAGNFGGCLSGTNQCKAPWETLNAKQSTIKLSLSTPFECIPIEQLQSNTELAVFTYLEINQIKCVERAKMEDFDITPPFKKHGRFRWIIEGEELRKLQTHMWNQPSVKAWTSKDGWKFKLKIDGLNRYRQMIDLNADHLFLPLDVFGYAIKIAVRYQDKTYMTYGRQATRQLSDRAILPYTQLGFAVKDIKGKSRIELDVEWKVRSLFGANGQKIRRKS